MKFFIAIPALILLVMLILALIWIFNSAVIGSNQPVAANNVTNPDLGVKSNPASLIASQKGVDLTINNIKKENNQTIIELSFNNHAYDLSKLDAKSQSSLNGVGPSDYKILNSAVGGHHLLAQMIFDGELSGALVIKLGDLLVFNFNI